MFPIPFNFPFRKNDGTLSTIGAEISGGGALPTASATVKGGVKIGSNLSMDGETLNASAQIPAHTSENAGKVLTVADDGSLEWDTKGGAGAEIISKTVWDELTTEEKLNYGLVAVQDSETGYERGVLCDGASYINAFRIWTESIDGFTASMNLQAGIYENNTFTPVGSVINKVYTTVRDGAYYNCFGIATLKYAANWRLVAYKNVTYNNTTYNESYEIMNWDYNVEKDFIVVVA